MNRSDRREFLTEVGQGMMAVLVGPALMSEMGLGKVHASETAPMALDRLASLVQETPPEKLLALVKDQLHQGTSLKALVAAAALANTHAFAGQHYEGYHTFMALPPAFAMAQELPDSQKIFPIFKVLYRNSTLIHSSGRARKNLLGEIEAGEPEPGQSAHQSLLQAARQRRVDQAERLAWPLIQKKPEQAYEELQPLVQDSVDVHRVVLTWRSWEILDFVGTAQARTMLRQTVRHCADYPIRESGHVTNRIRDLLPRLFDTYKLAGKKPGKRDTDPGHLEKLAQLVYKGTREDAAGGVAEALAEGYSPDVLAEAIALAATQLVLGDRGRPKAWSNAAKPPGSVHGDSVGVHASDAANAWRHLASVTGPRNTFASLICAAYHTAGQTANQGELLPLAADVEKVKGRTSAQLLGELDEAVRANAQPQACAIAKKYLSSGHEAKELLAVLRRYAVSEDGALHAEKYYRTATEELTRSRPEFGTLHLLALARVTASAHGYPAPGLEQARKEFKG